jgi:hypothetical protein
MTGFKSTGLTVEGRTVARTSRHRRTEPNFAIPQGHGVTLPPVSILNLGIGSNAGSQVHKSDSILEIKYTIIWKMMTCSSVGSDTLSASGELRSYRAAGYMQRPRFLFAYENVRCGSANQLCVYHAACAFRFHCSHDVTERRQKTRVTIFQRRALAARFAV